MKPLGHHNFIIKILKANSLNLIPSKISILTLLSMRVPSSIHVAANGIILFFFMAEYYSIVYIYYIFLMQSSISGHLGCFYVLVIVNSAAMNMQVHMSFLRKVLSGYMPKSGISESYGSSMYSFLRCHQAVLHSGCTSLHSHQQCRSISFSPHPLQHLYNGAW